MRLRREREGAAVRTSSLAQRRRRRLLQSRLRVVLAIVVVAVLAAGSLWALYFSSWLTAQAVQVDGLKTLGAARVRAVAAVPLGRPLIDIDLGAIRARVDRIPVVASAEVSRSWPHTVTITITERTPVAVVEQGGTRRFVDSQGVLFGNPGPGARLPLVQSTGSVKADALSQAGQVAASLPDSLRRKVRYLQLRSRDDIVLELRGGRQVVWGSASDSALKAQVAAALLRRKVQQVDVSVPGRPTTR